MAKKFSKGFYKSAAWQSCRQAYMKKKRYLCENCLARGIYTPGTDVHHIEELTPLNITNPEVTLNFDNLMLLCKNCHSEIHARKAKKRYEIGPNGRVIV